MSKKEIRVKAYRRKDGTYVPAHTRRIESTQKPSPRYNFSFDWRQSPSKQNQNASQPNIVKLEKPEPSPKDVLLAKYQSEIVRIDALIERCNNLMKQGNAYLESPEKIKQEIERQEIKKQEMKSKLRTRFFFVLVIAVLSAFFLPSILQKIKPSLQAPEAPSNVQSQNW